MGGATSLQAALASSRRLAYLAWNPGSMGGSWDPRAGGEPKAQLPHLALTRFRESKHASVGGESSIF